MPIETHGENAAADNVTAEQDLIRQPLARREFHDLGAFHDKRGGAERQEQIYQVDVFTGTVWVAEIMSRMPMGSSPSRSATSGEMHVVDAPVSIRAGKVTVSVAAICGPWKAPAGPTPTSTMGPTEGSY